LISLKGKGRLTVIFLSVLVIVFVLVGRYLFIMLILPNRERYDPVELPRVERGPILDRNGKIVAITTILYSVSAWVPDVENPEQTAALLAQVLNMDRQALLDKLSKDTGFVWIKRKITPTETERISSLKDEHKLTGINLEPEYGRNYPERAFAGHLIGYVGIDNTGLDGIEWSFERELFPSAIGEAVEEVYGNQVYLTIDMNIQYIVEKIARKSLEENRADYVMILVMDAPTAEILAYVSVPGFDPNNFSKYDPATLINRPIRTAYEPGSVFKIFTISAFLQLGGITPYDTFYAGGYYEKPEYGIRINDLAAYGEVNAQKILKYSSNVGAAYASETVNDEEFYAVLRRFGFGSPTGVPLSGETSGILRKPSTWSVRTKPTLAFGQEISVSAMQIMAGATVFANDGLLLKPRLVKKIVSPEGALIKEYQREPVAEVLSPEIARSVLLMMETATEEGGTARRAHIDGIRISAKTGTAQVFNPETGSYYEDRHIASFLGIFPTDTPRLIVYIVINHPKGEYYYGSRTAAPAFKELAKTLITLMGIPTEASRVVTHPGKISVPVSSAVKWEDVVPDLTGTAKRQLLPLFGMKDLEIVMIGEGYVVRQNPPPGTPVTKGMKLILEFE
jgi:cell division protein FtsI (penicillin-binding protein 3)